MFGDKLWYYPITIYLFFFGVCWIYVKYGEMEFGNVFARILGLYIILHLIDAFIKGMIFAKDHFKLTLTFKG